MREKRFMILSEKTSSRPWLIIPMEIIERELLGKLLLCIEATNRGWGCIIGTKRAIRGNAEKLPKGVLLLKSIIISELLDMERYRFLGFDIVCLDEEGLIQNSLEHMVEMRTQPETMAQLDKFMLWGTIQHDVFIRKMPEFSDKYVVVGNPRIDTWSKSLHGLYAKDVEKIKEKYGKYIILPTSFAMYNHFMGVNGAIDIYQVDNMMSDDDYQFQLGYRQYVKEIYYAFLELMPRICMAFPEHNIIIRPHPSENRNPWDKLAETFDNMHVEYEGGVSPWLLGADVVLHCGSTTAVEGHVMGKPVISYCPCNKADIATFDLEVPAKISINLFDQNDVLEMIKKIVQVGEKFTHDEVTLGHERLKSWIYGLDDENAVQNVMDVINDVGALTLSEFENIDDNDKKDISSKERVWQVFDVLCKSTIIFGMMPKRIQHGVRSRKYGKHKTRNLNEEEIKYFVSQISQLKNQLEPNVACVQDNLFMFTPSDKGT